MSRSIRRANASLRRFGAADGGATAVEFSLIAIPFFTLLFAILELGLVFFVSTTLENATDAAARQIRTGEVQAAGGTAAAFKTAICKNMVIGNCAANLKVDVKNFSEFANINTTQPLKDLDAKDPKKGKVLDEKALKWEPGGPESIVLVRAYYEWTLITPLMNKALQNLANGKRLITATTTFQNEPYEQ